MKLVYPLTLLLVLISCPLAQAECDKYLTSDGSTAREIQVEKARVSQEAIAELQIKDANTARRCGEDQACLIKGKLENSLSVLENLTKKIHNGWEFVSGKTLRSKERYWTDFKRNLAVTYFQQAIGLVVFEYQKGLSQFAMSDIHFDIFANTGIMMWLQAESGARNTPIPPVTPKVHSFRELWEQVTIAFHGEEGFWKETGQRFRGFLKLLPIEVSVLLSLRTIESLVRNGELDDTDQYLDDALFMMIFGTYLAARWSVGDKIMNLRILNVIENSFNETRMQRAAGLVIDLGWRNVLPLWDAWFLFKLRSDLAPALNSMMQSVLQLKN